MDQTEKDLIKDYNILSESLPDVVTAEIKETVNQQRAPKISLLEMMNYLGFPR